uniref:Uncharacterized protein n=1 Tax=Panagrolaimus davidi TaxID=227884 RepID=A0A914QS83_9BILA
MLLLMNCIADNSTITSTETLSLVPQISASPTPKSIQAKKEFTDTSVDGNITDTYDYEVCGNVSQILDCICKGTHLYCPHSFHRCSDLTYCDYYPYELFNSTNIKILNESFIVKIVEFRDNNLTTLQKVIIQKY